MLFVYVAVQEAVLALNQGFQLPLAFMQTIEAQILALAPRASRTRRNAARYA
jgi:hypothetical protein